MSLDTVINDLIAFDTEIDSVQIAEVLFLADVMGNIENQEKRLEQDDSTKENGKKLDHENSLATKTKDWYDVTHTIMLPIIHTSKEDFLISPHYDTFGNFLSPLELKLLIA